MHATAAPSLPLEGNHWFTNLPSTACVWYCQRRYSRPLCLLVGCYPLFGLNWRFMIALPLAHWQALLPSPGRFECVLWIHHMVGDCWLHILCGDVPAEGYHGAQTVSPAILSLLNSLMAVLFPCKHATGPFLTLTPPLHLFFTFASLSLEQGIIFCCGFSRELHGHTMDHGTPRIASTHHPQWISPEF